MKSNKLSLLIIVVIQFQITFFAYGLAADPNSPTSADSKTIQEVDSILKQNLTPEPESSKDTVETHARPLTTRDQKKQNISDYSKLISDSSYDDYNVLQKNQILKTSRLQLKTGLSKVLDDGFNSNFGLHLGVVYNLNETWGVGLGGDMLSSSRNGLSKNLQEIQLVNVDQIWTLKNTLNASLYVTPIYGKWALLNKKVLPFEIYFSLGVAQVTDHMNVSKSALSGSIGQLISLSPTSAFDISLQGLAFTAKNINNEDQSMNSVLLTLSYNIFWSTTDDER